MNTTPLGQTVESIEELTREITAWSSDINAKQRAADWQMKIDDARAAANPLAALENAQPVDRCHTLAITHL